MKTSTWVVLVIAVLVIVGGIYWYMQSGAQPATTNTGSASQTQTSDMPMQTNTQTSGTPAATTPTTSASVSIAHFAFSPSAVAVQAGGTVTWTNNDSVSHTVTSDDGSFASQTLAPGASFSHTFATAGTISYHCAIHPSMKGSVSVQ